MERTCVVFTSGFCGMLMVHLLFWDKSSVSEQLNVLLACHYRQSETATLSSSKKPSPSACALSLTWCCSLASSSGTLPLHRTYIIGHIIGIGQRSKFRDHSILAFTYRHSWDNTHITYKVTLNSYSVCGVEWRQHIRRRSIAKVCLCWPQLKHQTQE